MPIYPGGVSPDQAGIKSRVASWVFGRARDVVMVPQGHVRLAAEGLFQAGDQTRRIEMSVDRCGVDGTQGRPIPGGPEAGRSLRLRLHRGAFASSQPCVRVRAGAPGVRASLCAGAAEIHAKPAEQKAGADPRKQRRKAAMTRRDRAARDQPRRSHDCSRQRPPARSQGKGNQPSETGHRNTLGFAIGGRSLTHRDCARRKTAFGREVTPKFDANQVV